MSSAAHAAASLTCAELTAEWGLSLCVERNGRHILVDMGASDAFARNAEHLSIDVAAIDVAILSHHHCDHGGGLRRFLELNDHAPIYLGVPPDGDPTVKLLGFVRKFVGLDQALLATHAQRFRFVHERTEVLPGVFVLPRISGQHARPAGNKHLYLKRDSASTSSGTRHRHRRQASVADPRAKRSAVLTAVLPATRSRP